MSFLVHQYSRVITPGITCETGSFLTEQVLAHNKQLSIFTKSCVGVTRRSGMLTDDAMFRTSNEGLGQTTALGIGGDPVSATEFTDILEMFPVDEVKRDRKKPTFGLIASRTASPGRGMGHAWAIVSGDKGDTENKDAAMFTKLGLKPLEAEEPMRVIA